MMLSMLSALSLSSCSDVIPSGNKFIHQFYSKIVASDKMLKDDINFDVFLGFDIKYKDKILYYKPGKTTYKYRYVLPESFDFNLYFPTPNSKEDDQIQADNRFIKSIDIQNYDEVFFKPKKEIKRTDLPIKTSVHIPFDMIEEYQNAYHQNYFYLYTKFTDPSSPIGESALQYLMVTYRIEDDCFLIESTVEYNHSVL